MSDLYEKSGPWRGRWTQLKLRAAGTMRLHLTFEGPDIRGGGSDSSGPFTMDGSFDADTNEVAITKSYSFLTVLYRGRWDGVMIAGTSSIVGNQFFDTGEFEMWPESGELSIGEMMREEAVASL